MPQIQDTTGNIKTSFTLRVDAKAENFERPSIKKGRDTIIEGGIFKRDESGRARRVGLDAADAPTTITETLIYLNYVNPNAGSAVDRQTYNEVGGPQYLAELESGGYVGILGDNLKCGLPLTERFFVKADLSLLVVPGTRLVLKRELDATAERTGEVKFGAATGGVLQAPGANEGGLCFGLTDFQESDLLWFIFGNRGLIN
jgi:hypothetical protein